MSIRLCFFYSDRRNRDRNGKDRKSGKMTSVCHHSKCEAKPNSVYRRAITVLLAAVLAVGAVLFCVRGGVSAKYVSEFRQAVTLIIDPTKPIFASGSG